MNDTLRNMHDNGYLGWSGQQRLLSQGVPRVTYPGMSRVGASEAEEVLFAASRAEMTEEDVAPVCAAGGRKTGRELAAAVAAAAAFKAAFFFFCRARFEARFKARLTKNSFSSAGSPD